MNGDGISLPFDRDRHPYEWGTGFSMGHLEHPQHHLDSPPFLVQKIGKGRNEAEDKIHYLQNILPFAFSVARHSHKPFITNYFSWSTIRVMNVLNGVNLFCRRIVVMTCMLKFAHRGLQTKIKGTEDRLTRTWKEFAPNKLASNLFEVWNIFSKVKALLLINFVYQLVLLLTSTKINLHNQHQEEYLL